METATRVTGTAQALRQTDAGAAALRWVEAWAEHVRKRFNSRALVSVRVGGAQPLVLSHVYALEGGGLVLVATCGHEHDHGHGEAPEHHRAVPMAVPRGNGGGAAAHGPAHGEQAHGGHTHAGAEHGHAHTHGSAHPHDDAEACADCVELWLASPEHAVFEARCIEDGELCTGFGYLGLSRTPHVLVARGTEPPPKRDHHEHENF
jgi:hypothetical protein